MESFMNRRTLILYLSGLSLSLAGFIKHQKRSFRLKKNSAHLVLPKSKIFLPENPTKGDFVHLIVEPQSAQFPSKIVFERLPILNEKEDLTLDSFGLFKIRFEGSLKGWTLLS